MAEKVHPRGESPAHAQQSWSWTPRTASLSNSFDSPPRPMQNPAPPQPGKLGGDSPNRQNLSASRTSSGSFEAPPAKKMVPPPPGTYVVQLPKDQIFSYPPPENENKYLMLSAQKPRRSCCRLCLCYTLSILLLLVLAVAIAAGALYLVFRPEAPNYTVSEIAIRGMNLTLSSPMTPQFDVTIRAENNNRKLGIYYQPESEIMISYGNAFLGNGALPVFYQPSKNLTLFQTALKGSNVVLPAALRLKMEIEQRQGRTPFTLNVKAPVKIKVGAVTTWTITVNVKCDVTVDAINLNSRIISKNCDYSVKLW